MYSMLDDDLFDYESGQRLKRFPNFHHSSPLTLYPQHHIVDHLNGESEVPCIRLFLMVKSAVLQLCQLLDHRPRFTDDCVRFYNTVLYASKDRGHSEHTPVATVLLSALQSCMKEVLLDVRSIEHTHPGLGSLDKLIYMRPEDMLTVSADLSSCFKLYRALCRVRNRVQRAHVSGGGDYTKPLNTIGKFQCYAVNEILILFDVYDKAAPVMLINFDQLLMLADTVACRLMCRLACAINDFIKQDDLPSQDLLLQIYSWGDQVLVDAGMCAYALLGEFESIVTNSFVNFPESDPLRLGEPFFSSILETAQELESLYGISVDHTKRLMMILSTVTSPNQLSEIFGVRKHWGNPIVDAKASGRAVQDKVLEVLPVQGPSVVKLQASFNRLITLEYIRKNGKWPDCVFSENSRECLLYNCWKNKITRIPETAPNHNHYDWAMMRFLPNCIIDTYKDQLSLLSDKSVSLYRPNLMAMYVGALIDKNLKVKDPPENRRLMLEFLRKPHMSVLDILKTVMLNEIPFEWLCNASSMKGTEMKYLKARIFAVLTFELRQYFAVSEDIIKEHIFKYNPHQTMTMSEVKLLEKLREITKQLQSQVSSKTLNVIHIIDFSKWNLRMRYENTCTVFKSIDDFLGTPGLIERTHLIFESLLNVVQDAFNPPVMDLEKVASDTVWKFHSCGWEGQRQKGWTVITSALLSYMELLTGVNSEICGQGDNQVLLTKFPIPSRFVSAQDWITAEPVQVRSILDDYYERLEDECSKVGLKVKTAESCRSLCYLNYGKRLYFNGVELSMSLKRIAKMFTEPNDSYPTTEGRLKTMEGSIYAAGLYGHPGLLPYFMSRVGVYLNLDESYRFNPLIGDSALGFMSGSNCPVDSKFISSIMKIPPSLGGPPQQLVASYLCRGHPDPLCTDLVVLTLRSNHGDLFSQRLLSMAGSGVLFNPERVVKDSVILAPYSLNLSLTTSAKKPLERKVLSAVENYCKNPQIRGLFTSAMETMHKQLLASLSTMTPFHPLIANDIYSRSPPGRRQAFLSGLSNSTSLGRIVYDCRINPIIDQVCVLENKQLIYWFEYFKGVHCASINAAILALRHDQLAQKFRNDSWASTIEGVTVPHPLGQFRLCLTKDDVCAASCEGCQHEHIVCAQHSEDLISICSPPEHQILLSRSCESEPYLGNVINEGLTQKEVHCDTPEKPYLDAIRLNIIRRWVTTEGTDMDAVLRTLIKSKTDISIDLLDRASGRPSRLSFSHRAALISTIRSSAHCSTSNMHTRFYLSSNRMGEFSHGEMNYHLPFGPAFLILQGLLCWRSLVEREEVCDMESKRLVFHFHIVNRDVPAVYDGVLALTQSKLTIPSNIPSLLFSSRHDLSFTDLTGKSMSPLWTGYESASLHQCRILYASQLIGNGFVNEIVHHELASTETVQQYPPRISQISIGDVSLIGPKTLCECLAHHVLLFAPARIFSLSSQHLFETAVYRFLNNFSKKFWAGIAGPMSYQANLVLLTRNCPHLINYSSTKTSRGVTDIIQTVVAQEAWRLWFNLKRCILSGVRRPRMIISAPSVSSLRTVMSRYIEMCVYAFLEITHVPPYEVIALGRDLVANLHACDIDRFPEAYELCKLYYRNLSIELLCGESRGIPIPDMFYLQQPWVDRVRHAKKAPQTRPVLSHEDRYMLPNRFLHRLLYSLPESPIWTCRPHCDCVSPPRSYALHWECYFQVTGVLSKSGYKFLEIILTYNLPVTGLLCLGTSTGSEAASLTRLKENQRVYINCFHKLSSFAPHAAATYIPPSFLCEGDPSKLRAASSAALSTNDLTSPHCVEAILTQITGESYTGVTCDAEIPECIDVSTFNSILTNILELCSRIQDCDWLIIKIPIKCSHSVQFFLSSLSRLFLSCDILYSSFNRQKTRNFHFLAQRKRPALLPMTLPDKVVLTLNDYERWDGMLAAVDHQTMPPCLIINHKDMMRKVVACNVVPSSFNAACFHYIKGWGGSYGESVTTAQVISNLIALVDMVHDELIRLLIMSYRALTGLPLIRAGILERSDTPVQRQINDICYVYLRALLLIRLLQKDSRSYEEINSTIFKFLGKDHQIKLRSGVLRVAMDQSRFISTFSRYLFEILGHLFHCDQIVVSQRHPPVIHQPQHQHAPRVVAVSDLFTINYTDIRCRSSHSWKWLKRCFVLSLLLIRLEPNSAMVYGVCRYNHLLNSVITQRITIFDNYKAAASYGDASYIWIETRRQLTHCKVTFPVWLVYDTTLFADVKEKFLIQSTKALPWSGVIPSKLLSLCVARGPSHIRQRFVDVLDISNRVNPLGVQFAGCSCYSCTAEVFLTGLFKLSSADIDVLCSGLHLTNVLYKYHSSTD